MNIIILFLLNILFFFNIFFENNHKQIKVISELDNNSYLVNNYTKKKETAYILSYIRNKMIFLTENIIIQKNNEMFVSNIKKKIYKTKFSQNKKKFPKPNLISYNINKGEEIILCIYDYTTEKFYDMNTLIYVSIHELAHIGNPTLGHDESFYYIFNNLLEEAIRLKVYKFFDYEKIPQKYCGIIIKSNI